jgi:hypothetical protein
LVEYLPDYQQRKMIRREYLINVINTVKPSFFPRNIRELIKRKNNAIAEKKKSFIAIKPEFLKLIQESNFIARGSRGKAVHLLKEGMNNKKRKERPAYIKLDLPCQLKRIRTN